MIRYTREKKKKIYDFDWKDIALRIHWERYSGMSSPGIFNSSSGGVYVANNKCPGIRY